MGWVINILCGCNVEYNNSTAYLYLYGTNNWTISVYAIFYRWHCKHRFPTAVWIEILKWYANKATKLCYVIIHYLGINVGLACGMLIRHFWQTSIFHMIDVDDFFQEFKIFHGLQICMHFVHLLLYSFHFISWYRHKGFLIILI